VISNDQTLRSYAIDYHVGAHLKPVASVNLGALPLGVAVEPSGKYIYVATAGGISAFTDDPNTGALTAVALNPPVTVANTNGVYVEPSGKYLYLTSSTSNAGAVYAYTIGADGNLSAVAGSPIAAPNQPSSLAFRTSIN
jgi:6-phosphogluconolactonase